MPICCVRYAVTEQGLKSAGESHSSQGPGTGSFVAGPLLWGHDSPVGYQHNILAAKLLFQFPHQPLLDLVERLFETVWHLQSSRKSFLLLKDGNIALSHVPKLCHVQILN